MKPLLFLILLIVCWPLALVALILYPIVWLLMLPFRVLGAIASDDPQHQPLVPADNFELIIHTAETTSAIALD